MHWIQASNLIRLGVGFWAALAVIVEMIARAVGILGVL